MKQVIIARKAIVILLYVLFVALIPRAAVARYANSEGWVDQLTGFVVVQQGIAKTLGKPGSFDPYVGQVALVRSLYDRGDWKGTYMAMNRFMDMLEAREGAISATAADAMWDFCYEVTPPALHDVKRHKQWWEKTVDWEKFFWEE